VSGSMAWVVSSGVLAGGLPPVVVRAHPPEAARGDKHFEWRPVVPPVWLWVGLGAAAGLVLAVRFAHSSALPAYLAFALCAAPLCAADLASARIPDKILAPTAGLVLACFAASSAAGGGSGPLVRAVSALLVVGCGFFMLALVAAGGFGLGDVKLVAVLAALEGYQSWTTVFSGLFTGFAIAAVAGLAACNGRRSRQISLAPWLILGALTALVL
jgi:leader peptidase (prepilin peptidase) / N-methyltransferase